VGHCIDGSGRRSCAGASGAAFQKPADKCGRRLCRRVLTVTRRRSEPLDGSLLAGCRGADLLIFCPCPDNVASGPDISGLGYRRRRCRLLHHSWSWARVAESGRGSLRLFGWCVGEQAYV